MIKLKRNHNKEKNPNWSGGRFIDCRGYAFVMVGDKYVGEHRLVMEQHLGRRLDFKEKIHHKNGIKSDNRLENLQIVSQSEHAKIEGLGKSKHKRRNKWTKLKTLKEIEQEILQTNPPRLVDVVSHDTGLIDSFRKVRQEAIKWIKEDMENSIFEPSEIIKEPWTDYGAELMPNRKFCKCEPEFICLFHSNNRFHKFFNITEEDLK